MIRKFATLSLLGLALLIVVRADANAQSGIGPSNFPTQCTPTVSVTGVQYAGKDDRKDKILVTWTAGKPSSPCIDFQDFRVDLKLVRKHGNIDTGSKTFAGAERSGLIEVPRATLETDPVSFDVSIQARIGAEKDKFVNVTGTGIPSINSASQTPQGSSGPCDPSIKVTTLNFFPAATPLKDAIGVFWEASIPDACMGFSTFTASVKVTRADGSIQTGTSGSLARDVRSARVEVPKGVNIVSFEVRVTTRVVGITGGVFFSANKKGNF
jgi:hypothetical protein